MRPFVFPYDSQKLSLPIGKVHLARARLRCASQPQLQLTVAVDYDGTQQYAFRNTTLESSLLGLFRRHVSSPLVPIDLQIAGLQFSQVPSLLVELSLLDATTSTPPLRVRVFFATDILQSLLGSQLNFHGVFGRTDFPLEVSCRSTMTEFTATWP